MAYKRKKVKKKIDNVTEIMDLNDFIFKSSYIHDNRFDYSHLKKITEVVTIICPNHGRFRQKAVNHMNGSGCRKCKKSKGEQLVRLYLKDNNILFEEQKRFPDCKNKRTLPFDFYLPNNNILIEFDGAQHFKSVRRWGGKSGLEQRQLNDSIKDEYAKNNSIKLIRISTLEDINDILNEVFHLVL